MMWTFSGVPKCLNNMRTQTHLEYGFMTQAFLSWSVFINTKCAVLVHGRPKFIVPREQIHCLAKHYRQPHTTYVLKTSVHVMQTNKKTEHILNNNIIKTKFNELISRKMDCMPVRNMCNDMKFKFNRKHKGKYNNSWKFDFSEFVFTWHTFRKVLTLLKKNNKHVKNRALGGWWFFLLSPIWAYPIPRCVYFRIEKNFNFI